MEEKPYGQRPETPQYMPPPQMMAPRDPLREIIISLKTIAWRFAFPIFLVMMLASLAILCGTLPWVLEWLSVPGNGGGVYIVITPVPVGFWVEGTAIGAWFIIVVATIFASLMWGIHDLMSKFEGKPFFKRVSIPEYAESGLEVTAKLFMLTSFVYLVYVLILTVTAAEPVTPDFDAYPLQSNIFGFVNAAVNEELISRTLLIGIPLLFIETGLGARRQLRRYFIGGEMPVNLLTAFLIVFSSAMFALAHVAGAWDMYKLPTAFIAGLALGYLFVRFGLWASILLHFATNFLLIGLDIWPDNMALSGALAFGWLILTFAGAYFFLHYLKKLALWPVMAFGGMPERTDEARPLPTAKSTEQHAFICKNCGGYQARYDMETRALICLNCGYKERP